MVITRFDDHATGGQKDCPVAGRQNLRSGSPWMITLVGRSAAMMVCGH
jgi:hypothetical protein